MGKFSSEEIESQYNLIKMLLAEPEKYKNAINAIKKDIAYMLVDYGFSIVLQLRERVSLTGIFNFCVDLKVRYHALEKSGF